MNRTNIFEYDSFEYWENRNKLAKLLTKINNILIKFSYMLPIPIPFIGFCLHCYRFTFNLHDSSDQSYHCYNCCWWKKYI